MEENTINSDRTMGSSSGTILTGRYRVDRPLGQGGMGSVWLAVDMKLDNHPVAIKMLPSVLVSNKRAYNQLKAEALVALKLTHPNIATVRAFEENDGNPFLVMDYIDGVTLDDYLTEKGRLAEDEAIRLLKPIALALDYAHGEGVVHRDVKPGNVMIRKDGHPFVLDFGIAREIQETMTRVTGRLSSGTLMYMSPEQLNGKPPKTAQDVYSFAAMTYECLTGAPPFCRGQVEHQILECRPESLPDGVSIGASVLRGLEKEPADRPDSCAGVLSPYARPRPAKSAAAKPPERDSVAETPKRSGFLLTLLFIFVVAAAVLGWKYYQLLQTSQATEERSVVVSPPVKETEHVDPEPVFLTNTVVRIQTNNVIRTLVLTNYVDAPVSAPQTNGIPGSAQRDYLEVERLKTEISIVKVYAEGVVSHLNEYENEIDELGLAEDFELIARLKSSFDVDLSKIAELSDASNVWRSVAQARKQLDDYSAKFKMARLAHARKQDECNAAGKIRDALAGIEDALKECEAKRLAPELFAAAAAKRKSAEALYVSGQYVQAKASFEASAKAANEALRSARSCKAKAALQAAESFLAGDQWQMALDKADESLRWHPGDEAALRVKTEARAHLSPTLSLKATVDGKPVEGAKIVEGAFAKGETLPWTSAELEKGMELESFTVEYKSGKRRWRGSFRAISVDWLGPKTLSCPLKEIKEPIYECEFVPYFKNWLGTVSYPKKIDSATVEGAGEVSEEKDAKGIVHLIVSSKSPSAEISFLDIVADGKRKMVSYQLVSKSRKTVEVNMSE